ncbi:hypothetical protein [Secundilactobacillus collinoides]|uniref:hypothetical protein n=1 Tax=Secundilactobacillus collinoides TaxID=33960 RepID=UPI0006D2BB32|nr:hypothetical protein [Secundilactobacillus collinoides]
MTEHRLTARRWQAIQQNDRQFDDVSGTASQRRIFSVALRAHRDCLKKTTSKFLRVRKRPLLRAFDLVNGVHRLVTP